MININKRFSLIDFNNNLYSEIHNNNNLKVTELKMHKILYFQLGFFYTKYNRELWNYADFGAWKFGPVELTYRDNVRSASDFFICELNDEEIKFLEKLTKWLLNINMYSLIDLSHFTAPWKNNYVGEVGLNWKRIPNDEIFSYFKSNDEFLKSFYEDFEHNNA